MANFKVGDKVNYIESGNEGVIVEVVSILDWEYRVKDIGGDGHIWLCRESEISLKVDASPLHWWLNGIQF